jgi:alpha-tubulin suppressor-like RCC1 family protein
MWHTCELLSNGTLACWGAGTTNKGVGPDFGQSMPPSGTFTQVSASFSYTCGLKSDGTVVCWGVGFQGENIPPSGTFTQVSAGYEHACGLKSDGTLACWGWDGYGQATPPSGTFTQVSAGYDHTCGLKSDGTIACWGWSYYGQIFPPSGTFTQVNAGGDHTCGLKSNGTLACWGENTYNQINAPTGTFTQIEAGSDHTCALKYSGRLACWGDNSDGQATVPSGTFSQVSAGGSHTCGLKSDGTPFCWGNNTYGQLNPFTISGNAGVAGAALRYTDGTAKTVTADEDGNYSFNVPSGWSGTVTPYKAGVIFSPANRTYTNVTAEKSNQNSTVKFTVSYSSYGAKDGWILESARDSGVGGSMDATATTFRLGDDPSDCQYRVILSFNTAFLPDDAIIQSAILKIDQSGTAVGTNPFTVLSSLKVDIMNGTFGAYALELSDFNATATYARVASFSATPVGTWYSATLPANGRNNINKTGITQFRLYFATNSNNNGIADYMKFISGDYVTATYRPQLVIVYSLP